MKAMVIRQYGSNKVLHLEDIPAPNPGPSEYLIKVMAAGVNPVDWKLRNGMLRLLLWLKFPFTMGYDVCGRVVRTGPEATKFREGDWIYGLTDLRRGGACAEYAVLKEGCAAIKPERASPSEAAALPIAALTALQALRDKGALKMGGQVLVVGASGGVGHCAVQIAKAMGARVTGVCSTRNIDFVESMGADRVINYEVEDFRRCGAQYDIILDAVAAHSYPKCKHLLVKRGVYIATLPSFSTLFFQLFLPLFSHQRVCFINCARLGRDLETLNQWIDSGKLKVTIERAFRLEELPEAYALSEKGRVVGKLVIEVGIVR